MRTFLEFFCGGGMARLGLEPDWKCVFANDVSPKKGRAYCGNFADANHVFHLRDIRSISAEDLPRADLVWGSFPCQDLSLAGNGHGLAGLRSGLIWNLLAILEELRAGGSLPSTLVFENVNGLMNSRNGDDLRDIMRSLQALGYVAGVLAIDAVMFLPHSRLARLRLSAALKRLWLATKFATDLGSAFRNPGDFFFCTTGGEVR